VQRLAYWRIERILVNGGKESAVLEEGCAIRCPCAPPQALDQASQALSPFCEGLEIALLHRLGEPGQALE
jgi:hypothetical protein